MRAAGIPCLAIAALALIAPGLSGQAIEAGGGLAQIRNPPVELFDGICAADNSWVGEGRVGLRFSRAVSLEGTLGYHWESGPQCLADPVPIPDTGPFELEERETPGGFPFVTTDARLAFEPSDPSGAIWLRAFGGYGRMWSKDIGYWLAGAGLVFGARVQTVFEVEWNWFDVPYDATIREYMDGELVSETFRSGDTSHSTFRIRAGFRLGL